MTPKMVGEILLSFNFGCGMGNLIFYAPVPGNEFETTLPARRELRIISQQQLSHYERLHQRKSEKSRPPMQAESPGRSSSAS